MQKLLFDSAIFRFQTTVLVFTSVVFISLVSLHGFKHKREKKARLCHGYQLKELKFDKLDAVNKRKNEHSALKP